MVRAVLKHIAVDSGHLHMVSRERSLALHAALEPVGVAVPVVEVTALVAAHANTGVAHSQVGDRGLSVAATEAGTVKVLALKLVLDALAVGRVAN